MEFLKEFVMIMLSGNGKIIKFKEKPFISLRMETNIKENGRMV